MVGVWVEAVWGWLGLIRVGDGVGGGCFVLVMFGIGVCYDVRLGLGLGWVELKVGLVLVLVTDCC